MTNIAEIDLAQAEERVARTLLQPSHKTSFGRHQLARFLETKHQDYNRDPDREVTVWVSLSDHECAAWSVNTHEFIVPGLNRLRAHTVFRLKRDPKIALRVYDMTWTALKMACQLAYPL